MSRILAIDPGSTQSAWCMLADAEPGVAANPEGKGIVANPRLLGVLRKALNCDVVVIEWMTPRGMPTSAEEFETLYWAGKFAEARQSQGGSVKRLARSKIKGHICGNQKANDSNIRQALIDRYGGIGGSRAAIGLKASPGPLYGFHDDEWAALAVAVTYADEGATLALEG